jgi:hypothetical protein
MCPLARLLVLNQPARAEKKVSLYPLPGKSPVLAQETFRCTNKRRGPKMLRGSETLCDCVVAPQLLKLRS